MRLLRVELARLRMRRAVVLLVVACFAVPAFVWMSTYWNTREVSQAEKDQAAVQLQRTLEDPRTQRPYERCLDAPDKFGIAPGDDARARCEDMMLPTLDSYLSRSPLSLTDELENSGPAVAVLLTLHARPDRHDVRRPRLEHRVAGQPADLRAPPPQGLVGQGAGAW